MSGLSQRALRGLALAGALAALAPAASAQSLLAGRGLGWVNEPVEARGTGLGGVTLGLPEPSLTLRNPAAIAGLPAPALTTSFQYDRLNTEPPAGTGSAGTARFPLLAGAYPVNPRLTLALGFGSLLDQSWAVELADSGVVGGERMLIADRFTSEGGVSRLRLAGAYQLLAGLSLGLGVDVYTGGLRYTTVREFGGALAPASTEARWDYGGLGYAAGVHWVGPEAAFALDAAANFGGTLRAEPTDTVGDAKEYDLPLSLALGASGRISANTLLALSAERTGWSSVDGALRRSGAGALAQDTWSVRGGIEWDALSLGARALPLRLGGRYQKLPFRAADPGDDWPTERAVTGGLGVRLGGGAAQLDLGVERGWRSAEQFDERYWRTLFTVRVLGR